LNQQDSAPLVGAFKIASVPAKAISFYSRFTISSKPQTWSGIPRFHRGRYGQRLTLAGKIVVHEVKRDRLCDFVPEYPGVLDWKNFSKKSVFSKPESQRFACHPKSPPAGAPRRDGLARRNNLSSCWPGFQLATAHSVRRAHPRSASSVTILTRLFPIFKCGRPRAIRLSM
jgi:hypothetical protein